MFLGPGPRRLDYTAAIRRAQAATAHPTTRSYVKLGDDSGPAVSGPSRRPGDGLPEALPPADHWQPAWPLPVAG